MIKIFKIVFLLFYATTSFAQDRPLYNDKKKGATLYFMGMEQGGVYKK